MSTINHLNQIIAYEDLQNKIAQVEPAEETQGKLAKYFESIFALLNTSKAPSLKLNVPYFLNNIKTELSDDENMFLHLEFILCQYDSISFFAN